jgi:hypothetical protein
MPLDNYKVDGTKLALYHAYGEGCKQESPGSTTSLELQQKLFSFPLKMLQERFATLWLRQLRI